MLFLFLLLLLLLLSTTADNAVGRLDRVLRIRANFDRYERTHSVWEQHDKWKPQNELRSILKRYS